MGHIPEHSTVYGREPCFALVHGSARWGWTCSEPIQAVLLPLATLGHAHIPVASLYTLGFFRRAMIFVWTPSYKRIALL